MIFVFPHDWCGDSSAQGFRIFAGWELGLWSPNQKSTTAFHFVGCLVCGAINNKVKVPIITKRSNQEDFNVEDHEFTEEEVGCQSCGCTCVGEVILEWHMTVEHTAWISCV